MTAPTLGTTTQIAQTLTSMGVPTTTNQVHMWHKRAARNGFPPPIASVLRHTSGNGAGRPRSPLWDVGDVIAWWASYTPSKGGGLTGDRNNLNQWRQRQRRVPAAA